MSGDRPKCHQLKAGIRATLVEMSMDRCIVGVFSAFLLMGAVQRDAVLPESQGGDVLLLPVLCLGISYLLSPLVTVSLRGVARWSRLTAIQPTGQCQPVMDEPGKS